MGLTAVEISDDLLKVFTVVRIHAFTKGYMEKSNKKPTQKSKSLRKNCFTMHVNHNVLLLFDFLFTFL